MPNTLRADIRNHYRLEVFARSKNEKFSTEDSERLPPPIPTFSHLGLPKLISKVMTE